MGKMGDVANLGAVAIAGFVAWKLLGQGLPDTSQWFKNVLGIPEVPPPDEISGLPGPGQTPGFNIWDLLGIGGNGNGNGLLNGNGEGDSNDSDMVETVYVPVIVETTRYEPPDLPPITIHPTVIPDILTGMIARKPGFYAQSFEGIYDAGGGVNV